MIIEIFAYISVGVITIAYFIVLFNDIIQKITKSKNTNKEVKED